MNSTDKIANLTLSGSKEYLTCNPGSILEITHGTALVYLVPVNTTNLTGRKLFICEMHEGEYIPELCYEDYSGTTWKFCINALESCTITDATDKYSLNPKDEFAAKIKLKNYEMEGFEEALTELYRLDDLKSEGFIHRSIREQKKISESNLNIIHNMFSTEKKEIIDTENTNNVYKAVSYLCHASRIQIAGYDKIKAACKDRVTVEKIAEISDFVCHSSGIEKIRKKNKACSFIAFSADHKNAYAFIKKGHKFKVYDPVGNKCFTPTDEFYTQLDNTAYICARSFDDEPLTIKGIARFSIKSISHGNIVKHILLTLIASLAPATFPFLYKAVLDFPDVYKDNNIINLCIIFLFILVLNGLVSYAKNLSLLRISSRITFDTRNAMLDRLFSMPGDFYDRHDITSLVTGAMKTGNIASRSIMLILGLSCSLLCIIMYLIIMVYCSATLTIAGSILIFIYSIVFFIIRLSRKKHKISTERSKVKSDSVIRQLVSGIEKIRISSSEDRALYEFLKPYTAFADSSSRIKMTDIFIKSADFIFVYLCMCLLLIISDKLSSFISAGTIMAFCIIFAGFSLSVKSVFEDIYSVYDILNDYRQIENLLSSLPECNKHKDLPGELKGDIEINNVSFAYNESEGDVLSGINLHISEGEYVAIVGPSGCGKSTLLKLLLGFEKPGNGKIYYDSKDIDRLDKRELRKQLGVVLQDGKLIDGSIYDNITVSSGPITENKLNNIIESACLVEDIATMPMGIHTVISEIGCPISGGQKQRILIARALASESKILFFDEATGALDNHSQQKICECLAKIDATRVVIAHRLNTVIGCDKIVVLDKGTISECGSYEQLMEKKGLFYKLALRQKF